MVCSVCGENKGQKVEVRYFDGTDEHITLCDQCRNEFDEGGLVEEVAKLEVEEY